MMAMAMGTRISARLPLASATGIISAIMANTAN